MTDIHYVLIRRYLHANPTCSKTDDHPFVHLPSLHDQRGQYLTAADIVRDAGRYSVERLVAQAGNAIIECGRAGRSLFKKN